MDMRIDNEIRELICEIVLFVILLFVMVPICVSASDKYKESVSRIQNCVDISVSINNVGGDKFVILDNYGDEIVNVNLVLKIREFSNEYMIKFDDREVFLSEIDSTYDGEFYYYDLGDYKIDKREEIKYELVLVGDEIYNDNISYSFVAEVLYC